MTASNAPITFSLAEELRVRFERRVVHHGWCLLPPTSESEENKRLSAALAAMPPERAAKVVADAGIRVTPGKVTAGVGVQEYVELVNAHHASANDDQGADLLTVWRLMYPDSRNEPYLPLMCEWVAKMRRKLEDARVQRDKAIGHATDAAADRDALRAKLDAYERGSVPRDEWSALRDRWTASQAYATGETNRANRMLAERDAALARAEKAEKERDALLRGDLLPALDHPANEMARDALRADVERITRERDAQRLAALDEAARICESMVVGGRAWNDGQRVAADALFAAAKNIRAAESRLPDAHPLLADLTAARARIAAMLPVFDAAESVHDDYDEAELVQNNAVRRLWHAVDAYRAQKGA